MELVRVSSSKGPSIKELKDYIKKIDKKADERHIDTIRNQIITCIGSAPPGITKFFKTDNRITYELIKEETKVKTSEIKDSISEILKNTGMVIDDYIEGTCSFIDKEKDSRVFKIGKILNRIGETINSNKFQNDPVRQLKKQNNLYVTISKNPIDISLMSTFRGWRSCMELNSSNNRFVGMDILRGTLIVYLHKNDDMDLLNPVARILIKPYSYIVGNSRKVLYGVENRYYGQGEGILKESAQILCDMVNKEITSKTLPIIDATFDGNLYNDGMVQSKFYINSEYKDISNSIIKNLKKYDVKVMSHIIDSDLSLDDKIKVILSAKKTFGVFGINNEELCKNPQIRHINEMNRVMTTIYNDIFDIDLEPKDIEDLIKTGFNNRRSEYDYIIFFTNLIKFYYKNDMSLKTLLKEKSSVYIKSILTYIYNNTSDDKLKSYLEVDEKLWTSKDSSYDHLYRFLNVRHIEKIIQLFDLSYKSNLSKIMEIINTKKRKALSRYSDYSYKVINICNSIIKSSDSDFDKFMTFLQEDDNAVKFLGKSPDFYIATHGMNVKNGKLSRAKQMMDLIYPDEESVKNSEWYQYVLSHLAKKKSNGKSSSKEDVMAAMDSSLNARILDYKRYYINHETLDRVGVSMEVDRKYIHI